MTITIDIKPELEAELAAQATAQGMDVQAYAAKLLEEAATPLRSSVPKKSFLEFLRESPLADVELDLERDKNPGRDIEL